MARFVFQLDGLLRHRRHLERQRQRELAVAQKQMGDLQTEFRLLNQSVQQESDDLRNGHLTGRLDLAYLAAHRRYSIAMQRKAVALMQKMALAQRQIDDARGLLAEAAKQRKILEKLREKHLDQWRRDRDRSEMSQLDEISMQLSYWNEREEQDEQKAEKQA